MHSRSKDLAFQVECGLTVTSLALAQCGMVLPCLAPHCLHAEPPNVVECFRISIPFPFMPEYRSDVRVRRTVRACMFAREIVDADAERTNLPLESKPPFFSNLCRFSP